MDPAPLTFAKFDPLADVFEVFKNDDAVLRKRFYDLLRNAMVHITPEAVLPGSCLPEVSFGGFRTTFLKLSSQTLVTMSDSSLAIEAVVGADGYLVYSPVYAEDDGIPGIFEFRHILLEYYTEKNLSLAKDKLGRSSSPGNILLIIVREIEGDPEPAIKGKDRYFASIEPDTVTPGGITDRRHSALRAPATPLDSGLESLRCLHPDLDSEVGRKPEGIPDIFVGFVMQGNGIEVMIFVPDLTDVVESPGDRLNRRPYLFRYYG